MKLSIVYKVKQKSIRIIRSYCWKNFKQIRHISKGNFWCTLFTSLSNRMMVDNDENKVHQKFLLDMCLVSLNFFQQYDIIIRIGFHFILFGKRKFFLLMIFLLFCEQTSPGTWSSRSGKRKMSELVFLIYRAKRLHWSNRQHFRKLSKRFCAQ